MKRFITFAFLATIAGAIQIYAQSIKIILPDDDEIKGELVSATDSMITYTNQQSDDVQTALPMFVKFVRIKGVGTFKNANGLFITLSGKPLSEVMPQQADIADAVYAQSGEVGVQMKAQAQELAQVRAQLEELMRQQTQSQETVRQYVQIRTEGNVNNIAIGEAFEITGITALSIGVPCLAAGLSCCIAGHLLPLETNYYGIPYASDLAIRTRCLESSYYLFGIGASLTIVGIPLYVHGKKIMEMNINYTGNGAGLAFKF